MEDDVPAGPAAEAVEAAVEAAEAAEEARDATPGALSGSPEAGVNVSALWYTSGI